MKYFVRHKIGTSKGNGNNSHKGKIFHAVDSNEFPFYGKAFCGATPSGKSNGWMYHENWIGVTCPKCLEIINQEKDNE